jgi:hypothetical protein
VAARTLFAARLKTSVFEAKSESVVCIFAIALRATLHIQVLVGETLTV